MSKNTENPYKAEEFEAFIKILEEADQVAHWIEVAEALGVNKDTISLWKKHPRAVEARKKGISETLAGMQRTGAKDWRMYVEKLKMLGISPIEKSKTEHSLDDSVDKILKEMGLKDDGQTKGATESPPKDKA